MNNRLPNYVGVIGEIAAYNYLISQGYQIISENYRVRNGEIDLVAIDGEELVFAEVKSSVRSDLVKLMEAVTPKKQSALIEAAKDFLWREKIKPTISCRFDVLCVFLPEGSEPVVHHIQNAFETGRGV